MPSSPTTEISTSFDVRKRVAWYRRWWGIVLLVLIAGLLASLLAGGLYVWKIATLLRTGELTPGQLLGDDLVLPNDVPPALRDNGTFMVTTDDPSVGARDAKVVIVEFSDFQCPFCAEAYAVTKQLRNQYGDQVLFIFRDFPLEDAHPLATTAALAGECAHEQGKFWPLHDKIFENQADLSEASLRSWAIELGLNSRQFSGCLQSAKYFSEVDQDFNDGRLAGVKATPTFFINGQKVEGAINLAAFEGIIRSILGQ